MGKKIHAVRVCFLFLFFSTIKGEKEEKRRNSTYPMRRRFTCTRVKDNTIRMDETRVEDGLNGNRDKQPVGHCAKAFLARTVDCNRGVEVIGSICLSNEKASFVVDGHSAQLHTAWCMVVRNNDWAKHTTRSCEFDYVIGYIVEGDEEIGRSCISAVARLIFCISKAQESQEKECT